jgi:hypothetical protein
VVDLAEGERILRLLPGKYPEQTVPLPMPAADEVRIFSVEARGDLGGRLQPGLRTH